MNKIAIISGGGKLPLIIGKSLIASNNEVIFFCIDKFCNTKLYKNFPVENINITSLKLILQKLKKHNIEKIVMAGNVKRPSISEIKFDLQTLKLIKNFALNSKGDDKLLSAISVFFKNSGYPLLDWKSQCKDLFINDDILTIKKPSKKSISNKEKGLKIFEMLGKIDICQSMIIQNQIILGIEAAEGTDELIKRCYKYKSEGDKGVLLKLSKYKQDSNLDIPLIGINTVKKLKKYDYEGVFIEQNNCILLDKNDVINFCNSNNLFLSSVKKID